MSNDKDSVTGGNVNFAFTMAVVFSPVILMALVSLLVAYIMARLEKTYESVKLFCLPAGWLVSSVFWFPVLLIVTFIMWGADALKVDNYLKFLCDLNLVVIWGPAVARVLGLTENPFGTYNPTEVSHVTIILYQVFLWFTVGQRVTRQLAMGIYDSTMVRHARNMGVTHAGLHNVRVANSKAYAKDIEYYRKKGAIGPLLGLVFINNSGGDATTFYESIK